LRSVNQSFKKIWGIRMSNSTASVIYQEVKNDIIHNHYKAKQRIAEENIAKKFGASRTPVREALRRLEQEGYVECIQNVGTFVRQLSTKEVADYYDVRGLLEGLCARRAAERATQENVHELRTLHAEVLAAHERHDIAEANDLDIELHNRINSISGNVFAIQWLTSHQDYFRWFLNISNLSRMEYYGTIPMIQMVHNHTLFIDAIENGDADAAELHARAHVEDAKQYFIDYCYQKFMV